MVVASFIRRINRKLAAMGKVVVKTPRNDAPVEGREYHLLDSNLGTKSYLGLSEVERMARELGALAIRTELWETVGMAKKIKVGDPVMRHGSAVTYMVTAIDASKKTADIKNPKGETIGLHRGVPWSELSVLDESQNALRVVREATES